MREGEEGGMERREGKREGGREEREERERERETDRLYFYFLKVYFWG